jgi:hypothetical protein
MATEGRLPLSITTDGRAEPQRREHRSATAAGQRALFRSSARMFLFSLTDQERAFLIALLPRFDEQPALFCEGDVIDCVDRGGLAPILDSTDVLQIACMQNARTPRARPAGASRISAKPSELAERRRGCYTLCGSAC